VQTYSAQYDPISKRWPDNLERFDSDQTLAIVFGGSQYLDNSLDAWPALRQALPEAVIVGCSSSGEILDDQVYDDTLTAMVVRLERTRVKRVETLVAAADESRHAGRLLGEGLNEPDLKGVFVLSDGLRVNGSELAAGFNSVLPANVPVTGGLAGDGSRFLRTWVLLDGKPQSGGVTAVGFYGEGLTFRHGCKGGWDKFGIERIVTKSVGSVVYELDGRPALALYKEYLGDRAKGLPATGLLFPLAIRLAEDPEKVLVRTILSVDEEAQSLSFAGDVPQGAYAQLMKANFDRLVDGAAGAAEGLAGGISSARDLGALAIAISCVGRRLVLGERSEEELVATMAAMPKGTRQIGFYSYGEISPHMSGGSCELHNQTMTLTLLAEAAGPAQMDEVGNA
jgi:hypothetical protein